jgi:hypothetical protein
MMRERESMAGMMVVVMGLTNFSLKQCQLFDFFSYLVRSCCC